MDQETRTLLSILGFDESLEVFPVMSEIRRQFRRECLLKHPDKATGSKDSFQHLLSAYHKILSKHVIREKRVMDKGARSQR